MLNKLWFASIHLNLHIHFWHRCCLREILWKSSTPLQAIKADVFCMQETGGTFSFGCSPLVYFCSAHGQEQLSNVLVLKGPSQSLPAPRESVLVISWCFESVPQTQIIPGPEANVKWTQKKKPWKKDKIYFSAPSVVPWSVQWDITTLLTPKHQFTSLQS